jgi:uncharacterized protein (DUF1697 family)
MNDSKQHIALLRAINVGGHTVKMAALRAAFSALDYQDVRTLIASGNVIFRADAGLNATELATQIEAHLEHTLGYAVRTFIRTSAQLAVVTQKPAALLAADDLAHAAHTLYVGFLAAPLPQAAQDKLAALQTPHDVLRVDGEEIYWLCRIKSNESKINNGRIERAIAAAATFRNITTVRRLATEYAQ